VAVSVQSFKNAFSEYRKADDAEVQAKLNFARQRIDETVWGDKYDQGVMYLTAHLLAVAPAGQNAKLKPENAGNTIYKQEYTALKRAVTFGFRTAGVMPPGALTDPSNG
jgi:hypothetical protein